MKKYISLWIIIISFLIIPKVFSDCSALNNAVAYLALDGDANDNSTQNHPGFLNNSPVYDYNCKVEGCYQFNTTGSKYIQIEDHDDFTFSTGGIDRPMSICFWFITDETNEKGFMGKTDNSVNREWKIYSYNERFYFYMRDYSNSKTIVTYTSTIAGNYENSWTHICFIYDGSSKSNSGSILINNVNLSVTSTDNGYIAMENKLFPVDIGKRESDYLDGMLDEIGFWNYTLSSIDISNLYNGGTGCNPYTTGTPITPTLTIDFNITTGEYTSNPFSFLFNGTMTNTQDNNFNCTLYENYSVIHSEINLNLSQNTIWNFSTAGYQEGNDYNLSCFNTNSSDDVISTDVFIDTIQPIITVIEFNSTNTYYSDTNYRLNITLNDTNLAGYELMLLTNISDVMDLVYYSYDDSIGKPNYTISNLTNSSDWCSSPPCTIFFNLTTWDDHNKLESKKEKEKASIEKTKDKIKFKYNKGFIDINSRNIDFIEDKEKYKLKFNEKGKQEIIINSSEKIIRRNTHHKAHLIFPKQGKYFDLDSDDLNIVSVNTLSKTEIKIVFETNKKNVITESIGDLNINSESFEFTLIERQSLTNSLLQSINQTVNNTLYDMAVDLDSIQEAIELLPIILLYGIVFGIGYWMISSGNYGIGLPFITATIGFNFYFWRLWESDSDKRVISIAFAGLTLLSIVMPIFIRGKLNVKNKKRT